MNLKQAQAVLSDLLMKCEEEHVAMPVDPLETILEAIQALRVNLTHELKRSLMSSALDHMKEKYGYKQGASSSAQPQAKGEKKRKQSTAGLSAHKPQDQERYMRVPVVATPSRRAMQHPVSMHSPVKKKTRLKDEIRAAPAVRQENQKLVDDLVMLGEYELNTGRSQRGVTRLRAAKQIHDSNDVIKSGAQARQLDGIGVSAAEKVDVLLHGGLRSAMKEYEREDNADKNEEEEEEPEDGASEEEVEDAARQQETAHKRARHGANMPRALRGGKYIANVEKTSTNGDGDKDGDDGDADDGFSTKE